MSVKEVSQLLMRRNWRLAVAESATGGLLGHMVTKQAGSSRYFWGGVIAYANDVKRQLLGVRQASLERYGAVSAVVALEMAAGVRQATGVEVGLSVTGIAGPSGATANKPVGLYYLGLSVPGDTWCWRHVFIGNRNENNYHAAQALLEHLRDYLQR